MPKCSIYLRCVLKDEPTQALDREHADAVAYFMRELQPQGFELAGVVLDSHHARRKSLAERRYGREMSLGLQRGDAVIVPSLGVFAGLSDCLDLWDEWSHRDVQLHVVNLNLSAFSATGWQWLNSLKALRSVEREWKAEQIKVGLRTRRKRGKLISGQARLGMKLKGRRGHKRFVTDEETLELMRQIFDWRTSGLTFEKIHAHLWMNKIHRPDGSEFSEPAIRRMYYRECERRQQEALAASPGSEASAEPVAAAG